MFDGVLNTPLLFSVKLKAKRSTLRKGTLHWRCFPLNFTELLDIALYVQKQITEVLYKTRCS